MPHAILTTSPLPPVANTPTTPPAHSPSFNPSPEQTSRLLSDLVCPDLSLRALAQEHGTTLDQLTLFLARPDIAEQVALIEATYAQKARLVATAHLPTVAHMLTRMIDDHLDEAAHIPVNPKSLPAIEQRRRSRETARRAANLLLRIARFTAATPSTSPSLPRGTGVPPGRSSRRRDDTSDPNTAPPSTLPTSADTALDVNPPLDRPPSSPPALPAPTPTRCPTYGEARPPTTPYPRQPSQEGMSRSYLPSAGVNVTRHAAGP